MSKEVSVVQGRDERGLEYNSSEVVGMSQIALADIKQAMECDIKMI